MAGPEHLHHDDTPSALAILTELLDHRQQPPEGWEPTGEGASVDWDLLDGSWLSSTEKAAVHIARGCALAERHGGLPLAVAASVREAIEELTGGWTATPSPTVPSSEPGIDPYPFVDPVGLNPYDPDVPDESKDCEPFEWLDGPAWRYILTAERLAERHRRAQRSEPPEPGSDVEL